MLIYKFALVTACVLSPFAMLHAQGSGVADSLGFQGYLARADGTPLDSNNVAVTFKLYKNNSAVWTETQSVDVDSGRFHVYLGAVSALDTVAFDQRVELGVTLDGDPPEMTPRTPLVASPFAFAMRGIHAVWADDGSYRSYNIVGGHPANSVGADVVGATIAGGGGWVTGLVKANSVTGDFGTVGGGTNNVASGPLYATIAGGRNNTASNSFATVGGGSGNTAFGYISTVGGGSANTITGGGSSATISGGGLNNAAGDYATIPGGYFNHAEGKYSFAAGQKATAAHGGSFVWADSTNGTTGTEFASTAENQFLIRARGGVGMGTNNPLTQLHVVDNISAAASASNHVALIDNVSTGSSADVLALRIGRSDNPESTNSFITFIYGSPGAAGFIRGSANGGIELLSNGADYAEYLPHLNPEESLGAGDVVGVFEGHVSHLTHGADQVMVVSTAAIVVGNHHGATEVGEDGYSKIAFIGQAPVNVLGPVQSGDFLIPSGSNDGLAVPVDPAEIKSEQIRLVFATAWESNGLNGPVSVNAAIGIDQSAAAIRAFEALQAKDSLLEQQILSMMNRLAVLEAAITN